MCKTHNPQNIDECIKPLLATLSWTLKQRFKVVASCCGHSIYPMTIVIKNWKTDRHFDLISEKYIPRKTRFYVKDEQGYYFIPETIEKSS